MNSRKLIGAVFRVPQHPTAGGRIACKGPQSQRSEKIFCVCTCTPTVDIGPTPPPQA